jgi:hypothetical protein
VAPAIFVQVTLSAEDCHWYPMPPPVLNPDPAKDTDAPAQPDVADIAAVPAFGVPAHAVDPVQVILITGLLVRALLVAVAQAEAPSTLYDLAPAAVVRYPVLA